MGVGVGCVLGVASRSWRSTLRVGVPSVLARLLPGSEVKAPVRCPADRGFETRFGTVPLPDLRGRRMFYAGVLANVRSVVGHLS